MSHTKLHPAVAIMTAVGLVLSTMTVSATAIADPSHGPSITSSQRVSQDADGSTGQVRGIERTDGPHLPATKIAAALGGASGSATVFVEVAADSALEVNRRLSRQGVSAARLGTDTQRAARQARNAAERVARTARRLSPSADVLYTTSYTVPGVALRIDAEELQELASHDEVRSIRPMTPKRIAASTPAVPQSKATRRLAAPRNASSGIQVRSAQAWAGGSTGQGQTIAVIDTGIDYTHVGFGGPGGNAYAQAWAARNNQDPLDAGWFDDAKIVAGYDFAGEHYDPEAVEGEGTELNPQASPVAVPDANPIDPAIIGHGTHVAATAAGYGVTDSGAVFTGDYADLDDEDLHTFRLAPGAAPQAQLIALKVFGDFGESTELVGQALEWVGEKVATDPGSIDVVNLSLGSDFAPADDPDNAIIDALTQAGVVVVAAAGNAGNVSAAGGSPGNARSALTVAASDSGFLSYDSAEVTAPAHFAGSYPGRYDNSYTAAAVTGQLAKLPMTLSGEVCAPLTPFQKSRIAGRIAWIDFPFLDFVDPVECPIYDEIAAAGALGIVVDGRDTDALSAPVGTGAIPVFQLSYSASEALAEVSGSATITLDPTQRFTYHEHHPLWADTLASFSSRGEFGSYDGIVKPDVAAPGYGIVSALVGSGNGAQTMDGTSMATPLVAGIAALVRQAQPTWDASRIKTQIMNTATHDVRDYDGNLVSPLRTGTGRVDASAAVESRVTAGSLEDGTLGTASFGVFEVGTSAVTKTRSVQVANSDTTAHTYDVSYLERAAQGGVEISVWPQTLTIPAGETATVTVTLSIPDPKALKWSSEHVGSFNEDDWFFESERNAVASASGLVILAEGSQELRLPVVASPKPTSDMKAIAPQFEPGFDDGFIELSGRSLGSMEELDVDDYMSVVIPMELGATDPRGDAVDIGLGPKQAAAADIVAVGALSDYPIAGSIEYGQLGFGVATAAPWGTLNPWTAPTLYISTDADPEPEYRTYVFPAGFSDALYAVFVDIETDQVVDYNPINVIGDQMDGNVHDSDVVFYSVMPAALGIKEQGESAPITYWFATENALSSSAVGAADISPRVRFDVKQPGLAFSYSAYEDVPWTNWEDGYGIIDVTRVSEANSSRVMLFHLHNRTGKRMEILGHGPEIAKLPEISGGEQVGDRLNVSTGAWKRAVGATYSYQWYRDEEPIPGATRNSYTLRKADINSVVSAAVTARTSAGRGTAVADGVFVSPADGVVFLSLAKRKVRYGKSNVTVTVTLGKDEATAGGTVEIYSNEEYLRSVSFAPGQRTKTLRLPKRLSPGRHELAAIYEPTDTEGDLQPGYAAPRTLRVLKAKAKIAVKPRKLKMKAKGQTRLRVKVRAKRAAVDGAVVVKSGKRVLARGAVKKGRAKITIKGLKKGKYRLRVTYRGSVTVTKTTSKVINLKVR